MRVNEPARRCAEPIACRRLSHRARPEPGQRLVELVCSAVHFACATRSRDEQSFGLPRSMATMQHPGDPQVLVVTDATRKSLTGLPRIGQLIIGQWLAAR